MRSKLTAISLYILQINGEKYLRALMCSSLKMRSARAVDLINNMVAKDATIRAIMTIV
jgi:hypothetical protein